MAQEPQSQEPNILSDINVKLRDIEEKQNIIKDRVLLIGENLISEKEENEKEILELKSRVSRLEGEIKGLKVTLQMSIDSLDNFARRNEFDILKRQFEMFQPLEIARISDVEAIIDKKLKQKSNK